MVTDSERETVRTQIPPYQRDEWRAHADELGMTQSEFVRSMVQAGRRGFDPDSSTDEPGSKDATPGVDDLERQVLDALTDGVRTWDELVAVLTENLEVRLETVLRDLQREGRVQYNGREGGYTATDTNVD